MKEAIQKSSSKWQATYLKKNPWAKFYGYSKARAPRIGVEHKMSVADFKSLWERDNAIELSRPSIDRIDPKKGYLLENCRFIDRGLNTSIAHKGKPSWNKGLTGITTNKKGGIPWNKGQKQNGKSN